MTFKIVNARDIDGQPTTLFDDKFPVKIWKEAYTGFEKSIAEIEAKRKIEYRPILEILQKSGNINFWENREIPDLSRLNLILGMFLMSN
ncbi:DUF5007 domain-containing protein [Sphingobacterium sp. E70]|uniref:DUF5007 domain-containing protein n=1 Tax=Sphingobacterium sp. E70 TaxID=2853439 RepID=UPI00359C2B10|nr:DUF5007 domain-containing protein [Sphingobacterium sp. E70]